MQLRINKTEAAAFRGLYEIDTLIARRGRDSAGERPPKRPMKTYLRIALLRRVNEVCSQISAIAEEAASAARAEAAQAGEDGHGDAADAMAERARVQVWQELTGYNRAWDFMVSLGADRNFAD